MTGGPPSPGSAQTLEDLRVDIEWAGTPAAQCFIKDTFYHCITMLHPLQVGGPERPGGGGG